MTDEKKPDLEKRPRKKGFHRQKRVWITTGIFLIIAIAIASYWYLVLRGYISTDDAYIDGDQIGISSKILGRVAQLTVSEGDTVSPGQLLVQLDDADLKAQEAQAKAALEYTEQSVPVARINLDRAQEDYDRASFQYKDKVITREQYDHASKALDMAKAQFNVAQSQVKSSQAQLTVVETQLGNTHIVAPAKAVVAKKWVVVGDIVQAGQPVYTLLDLSDLWITANFEETKLESINLGDPVQISIDAYPGHEFNGKVSLIASAAASQFSLIPPNNASGNFTKVTQRIPIKISLLGSGGDAPQDKFTLLPGMSVEVKIQVKAK